MVEQPDIDHGQGFFQGGGEHFVGSRRLGHAGGVIMRHNRYWLRMVLKQKQKSNLLFLLYTLLYPLYWVLLSSFESLFNFRSEKVRGRPTAETVYLRYPLFAHDR